MRTADVLVAGGGPAGLVAAISARRHGLEVGVVDHARPPIDKACGEGLMPDGITALGEVGVVISPEDGSAFHGIRFLQPGSCADAPFPGAPGVGMRRLNLHRKLLDAAAEAGVAMHWGHRITALAPGGAEVDGQTVRCRWVLGADGQNSLCRRWAGLEHYRGVPCRRIGLRRHYRLSRWTNRVEVYWGEACQVYITPVGPAEVCVALITRNARHRFEDLFSLFPEVAGRLLGAAPLTGVRGAVTAAFRLRSVLRGNVALVGDASGSVDPLTGEGLSLAFRQAVALGKALAAGDLARYEAEHRRILKLPHAMAELMLAMDRHPGFRARVLRALSSRPDIFARLLAIHVGAAAPASLGLGGSLSLGWNFLTA